VEATLSLYPRTLKENIQFFKGLSQYDIIFLQRKRFNQPRLGLLRKRARWIVYDFDDAVMYRNSKAKDPISRTRRRRFVQMIQASDFVIAGNEFLKKEVLPYNSNVEIIPTSIDLSRYTLKEEYHQEGPITIGWLGSSSTLKYLEPLLPIFDKIYQKGQKIQLKIVCDQFLDAPNLPIIKKRWSFEEEERDLKSFDIGLMPLVDDPWSWGKCGLKIIQYQGVGVPVVCTPVGINRDLVEDGVNGFWAKTPEEWEEKLCILIENHLLREQMGREGRKKVLEGYSVQASAPRLLFILKQVAEKR
jgi:glycosyltransferase involved in cell wall biosynthesis